MIGRDLRVIREACDVTMGDLADEWGLSESYILDIELGRRIVEEEEPWGYVEVLARIVREHTPPVTIEASEGER